jgi:hypothetical protein
MSSHTAKRPGAVVAQDKKVSARSDRSSELIVSVEFRAMRTY